MVWALTLLCLLAAAVGFLIGTAVGEWTGQTIELGLLGAAVAALVALSLAFVADSLFGRGRRRGR